VIAQYISKDRGLTVAMDQIVVTPGGKAGADLRRARDRQSRRRGDRPEPGLPIYESAVRFAGGTPVSLMLNEDRGFRFGAADIERLLTPGPRW